MARNVKSLRDLLPGEPHPEEKTTQQVLARWRAETVTEHTIIPDPLAGYTAKLPGDDPSVHPKFSQVITNPIPGTSPIGLLRMLKAGEVPQDLEKKVLAYLQQYQTFSGDAVFGQRR